MFTNLIFLILTLLAIDLAPQFTPPFSLYETSVILSCGCLALLLLFYAQKRLLKRKVLSTVVQVELLLSVVCIHYILGIQNLIPNLLASIFSISFYLILFGIAVSWQMMRFLFPFTLPFLAYIFINAFLGPILGEKLFFFATLLFLFLVLLLLPLTLQWAWRCSPFPSSPLKERLDDLCRRCNFHHGGLLIWGVMSRQTTAAIIGIFPRMRYILFTERLLHAFPEDEVEAILAHEIGHSFHKHLILYPLLIFGLPISGYLFSPWIDQLHPLLFYLSYALLMIIYFRFFLGFFSRNFERQADLHVFNCGLSAQSLIRAFERTVDLNSLPKKKANWHHGSFETRINYLKRAENNPALIQKHHRLVRIYLISYLLSLAVGILICLTLIN